MDNTLDGIFRGLSDNFLGLRAAGRDWSERSLRALTLVTQLRTPAVSTKSYELFRTIMDSKVVQERKMVAARLALDAAYQPGFTVGDPKHIIDFLRYCFDQGVPGENSNHSVSATIRTTDPASDDPTSQFGTWGIEDVDKLLAEYQQEMEKANEAEGATAVGTLEGAHGGLSAFLDGKMVRDKFLGIRRVFISVFSS